MDDFEFGGKNDIGDLELQEKILKRKKLIYQFIELRKEYNSDFFYHNSIATVLDYFIDFIENKGYMYKNK